MPLVTNGLLGPLIITRGLSSTAPVFVGYEGDDVQGALMAWWADQTAIKATLGSPLLWHVEAPEGVRLPYVTYFLIAEPDLPGRTTSFYHLDALVQINAHAETDAAAADIRDAIRAAIEGAPLVIGGNPAWHVLPGDEFTAIGEGRGADGADCWVSGVEVSIPHQVGQASIL